MLPAVAVAQQSLIVNGRKYAGTPGSAIDVPDMDARLLGSNGWVVVAPSGPTASRPSINPNLSAPYTAAVGSEFYDTTLSKLIIFDGATWRDPVNGNAV
jgi:hypothetical protein